MRIVFFAHSFLSDWNHGNAHFLRGVVTQLVERGHDVRCYEPRDAWSVVNLLRDQGQGPLEAVRRIYPRLDVVRYVQSALDLDEALDGVDLVVVHEWNEPALVAAIGKWRRTARGLRAYFHDTHHRAVSAPQELERFDLEDFDGVLAFAEALREVYLARGWAGQVWTWHEAADPTVFRPLAARTAIAERDVVWVGNWGDEERSAELNEYLVRPCADLGLDALVHGVRYPRHAIDELTAAGIGYGGWLANYEAPAVFARFAATVHVPRGPYVRMLPGVPTIRVFEALACGIPLVSAPWEDREGLFEVGSDFLMARDAHQMRRLLRDVLSDREMAAALSVRGRETILARHTCSHRVDQLLAIHAASITTQARQPSTHDTTIRSYGATS